MTHEELMRMHEEKFGVKYSKIVDMDVMTPGQVNWWFMSEEMLREIASSYDVDVLRAPIVLDHKREGPAQGHVLQLNVRDEASDKADLTLVGTVGLTESGVAKIESGEWNERSVLINDIYPMDGVWYLEHLSLLGAANPAVPCLQPVVFPSNSDIDNMPASMARAAHALAQRLHTWSRNELYWEYRVRPLSRFKSNTLSVIPFDEPKGIFLNSGVLKPKYVPEGLRVDSSVAQAALFKVDTWDLPKAKTWVMKKEQSLSASMDDEVQSSNIEQEQELLTTTVSDTVDETNINEEGGTTHMPVESTEVTTTTEASPPPELTLRLQAELEAKDQQLRAMEIQTKVTRLRAAGHLVPAQINSGLVQALLAIPESAKINDVWAGDVILEAFESGGKLFHRERLIDEEAPETKVDFENPDLEALADSGVRVSNVDVAKRVREIMHDDPKISHAEALTKARREHA